MTNLYSQLAESFPQEMERTINKGGVALKYIPVSEIINRLNKVLGVDNWSMTIQSCGRDQTDPDFVVAHVRLSYFSKDNGVVVRDGIGGQKIKRNKQGGILDLGDEFKGAISDALKKAAQAFGVGLYLARSDEAMEIEQVIDAQELVQEIPPLQSEVNWNSFMSVSKSLSKEQKEQLRAAWSQWSKGKATPKKENVTEEEAEFLLAEATRLVFNGTIVETK